MTRRILVVDDVAANRIVMKVKLRQAYFDVLQADTSEDALAIAQQLKPDLIILDMGMTDADGVNLCERLKAEPATAYIPVILVATLNDQASKIRGLRMGADDFLTKPVDELTLLARVRSLLRAGEAQRLLSARDEACAGRGMSDPAATFHGPANIATVTTSHSKPDHWTSTLSRHLRDRTSIRTCDEALAAVELPDRLMPDIFIIPVDLVERNDGLRLLADLRSRGHRCSAQTIILLPEGDTERAAMALDLGAGDILYHPLDRDELVLRVAHQLRRKRQTDRLEASVQEGLEMAVTDSLTGLHNRRYAMHHLEKMGQSGAGLTVMMLDLDHFKQINDRFGHASGDKVLAAIARRLSAHTQNTDLLARIGGEEFLLAFNGANRAIAFDIGERLRHAVGAEPIQLSAGGPQIRVTLSVGIALTQGQTNSAEALLEQADRALYRAKAEGRNAVTMFAA